MNLIKIILLFLIFPLPGLSQQTNSIIGKVIDHYTGENVANVSISVDKTLFITKTKTDGTFQLSVVHKGEMRLKLTLKGYQTQNIPIQTNDSINLDLGIIRLKKQIQEENDVGYILLNDADFVNAENGNSTNITGILGASKSNFQKAAAYQFSPAFFKIRGLDSKYQRISFNGTEMNSIYNGRPNWSTWGGLNDVTRNQTYTPGFSCNTISFGGINGDLNINSFAANFSGSKKVSLVASNKNYKGGVLASYFSGLQNNGWSYAFSASYRFAEKGFFDGSVYKANSIFAAISKKIKTKHHLHFTGIYTDNQRGKSSPNTREVYDLKNNKYNAYWGYHDGVIRNSRVKSVSEPLFMLSHVFNLNTTTTIQTNVSYQFGKISNSRLDYGGSQLVYTGTEREGIIGSGTNPDPAYYQKLPSYFLRNSAYPDYDKAYLTEQEFMKNGQLDWGELYATNLNTGYSVYALYEDVNKNKQFTANSIFNKRIHTNLHLDASVSLRKLLSENYAKMKDLLGGTGYLDVDNFSESIEEAQNDLQDPDRIIHNNDKFKYDYELDASQIEAFSQLRFDNKKTAVFLSAKISDSKYQRNGIFENGRFPGERSRGKSEILEFMNYGIKGGLTYKFNGRHILKTNLAYQTEEPTLQNSFSNARENNDAVIGLTDETISSGEIRYLYRSKIWNTGINVYFFDMKDATRISFYFAEGLTGLNFSETTAFVQEILKGIHQQNMGIEASLSLQLTTALQLNGVAAIGQSVYANNPELYLTSDDFKEALKYGKSYLKDYHFSNGPQQAYSIGMTYNSPKYWWLNIAGNYFKNAYINVSPLLRTNNFYRDNDGIPLVYYDENRAKDLLRQESFKPYFLLNAAGGKSWKINDYYIGFFAVVNNVLNQEFKTGGFEQSRNANYQTLLEDKSREKPIFGPKYWYGYGTTFYTSVYVRF